jgi:hypothetical protein
MGEVHAVQGLNVVVMELGEGMNDVGGLMMEAQTEEGGQS